jgi:hypothetical protein
MCTFCFSIKSANQKTSHEEEGIYTTLKRKQICFAKSLNQFSKCYEEFHLESDKKNPKSSEKAKNN